ncbi:efflux RND transporter periplasmic adaptor subunit [Aquabacterium sp. OR-4]|uniref:efflux RND transporter periplasmic adaptor subunit n=1 Tax=Aquabacterium sp. OR-4 TaxID=2978127 RepID=UPI0028C8F6B6|nr:efflux RND transporter periplasmic adaptor subunit [Aquabacterium sp. OR-4]MDT7835386.1 efflux RND transporter periplasmic adaptor subunit [Aquabacterium sp. OR-4]
MRKPWLIGMGGVVAVAAVVATVVAVGRTQDGAAAKAAQAASGPGAAASAPLVFRANEVVQPALASLPQRIEFSGPLVAPNTAVVRAKTSGTLVSLSVAEGSRVAAGQAIGRIDQAELASRLAERSANIDSARASLAQAERTHASNERLAAQNFISPVALDQSRATLDAARAALQANQAALETTRVAGRDAVVVAPIAGIVAKRQALPGEKLAMEQPVVTIVDLAQLELAGSVGTHEVTRLVPGMAVQVQVEGVADPVGAKLVRIAPAAEPGTRSIGVTVALANPKELLRAGQYAMASVLLADDRQRLLLPLAAVGSTAGQAHVWVIDGGKLLRRAVTLGQRDEAGGRVELLAGLDARAQVLASRFDNLREGQPAQVGAASAGRAAAVASAAASGPSATALR